MNLANEKSALEVVRTELAQDEEVLAEKSLQYYDLLYELEQKAEEFEILMAESEILQEELMMEIAAKEKDLKQAKYDEYLARLALQGDNPPSNATWVRPVSNYRLTSAFGMRKHPVLKVTRMHNGVDMACAAGTPIYATRAGTVTTASYQASGAGNYVSINHLDGFASIYMHMTHYVVSKGQTVSQGQLIGYVGNTGISTGDHLHFGISYAGTYVNPLAYIY
jgi:murein DD-endopeptidase MepM/ murein hydrolase activator NlpD